MGKCEKKGKERMELVGLLIKKERMRKRWEDSIHMEGNEGMRKKRKST